MTAHICLVSDQILPNVIATRVLKPDTVHLVVSASMREQATRLKRLLEKTNVTVHVHHDAPVRRIGELRDFALGLISNLESLYGDRGLVLNATGGTKPMALSFVQAFTALSASAPIVYVNTEAGVIEWLDDSGGVAMNIPSILDIPDYMAAYGITYRCAISDNAEATDVIIGRKPLTKSMAKEAAEDDRWVGALNYVLKDVLDDDGDTLALPVVTPERPLPGAARRVLHHAEEFGLVTIGGEGGFTVLSVDAARYLRGGWLEEYAWHTARDAGLDDVRLSVTFTWDGNRREPARNEMDVVIVHGNRMMLIECKTANITDRTAQTLYKLESLGRNAGGLYGRQLLLSARGLRDDEVERARAQHVEVLQGGEVTKLRDSLLQWAQEHQA